MAVEWTYDGVKEVDDGVEWTYDGVVDRQLEDTVEYYGRPTGMLLGVYRTYPRVVGE